MLRYLSLRLVGIIPGFLGAMAWGTLVIRLIRGDALHRAICRMPISQQIMDNFGANPDLDEHSYKQRLRGMRIPWWKTSSSWNCASC